MSRDILLIYPGKYKALEPQIPLSLLYIADSLMKAGYKVRIFDMRVEDFSNLNIGEPLFVGISSMSGTQIEFALRVAKKIRSENPSIPIIWGGVHPTLLPKQTASHSLVDIVVQSEGEETIVELAKKLSSGDTIHNVKGITYKIQKNIVSNPPRPFIDLNSISIDLPYDLLKLNKYPALKDGRIHIQTSRGCPSKCGFCYNTVFNQCKWRAKSVQQIINEIKFLLEKFPNIKTFDIIDDNFFVDQKRVENFCKEIKKFDKKIKWRANCRFDYVARYDKDFISLLDNSGCVELDFGGESGSIKLQNFVSKEVEYSQIISALVKLKKFSQNIEPYVSWLCGLPNESITDLHRTFDLMDKMKQINPKTQHYAIFVYTPFPSPLLQQLPTDFKPPQTLDEWAKIDVFHFNPPWHTKNYVKKLHTISAVTRLSFYPKIRIAERGFFYRNVFLIINKIAQYRWRHRFFEFPIEQKIVDYVTKKIRGFV